MWLKIYIAYVILSAVLIFSSPNQPEAPLSSKLMGTVLFPPVSLVLMTHKLYVNMPDIIKWIHNTTIHIIRALWRWLSEFIDAVIRVIMDAWHRLCALVDLIWHGLVYKLAMFVWSYIILPTYTIISFTTTKTLELISKTISWVLDHVYTSIIGIIKTVSYYIPE